MDILTVGAALAHPCIAGVTLTGGRAGLRRPVETVGILDLTDLDAVRPHQFVLSSAYPLRHLDLRRLVREVADRGASALGVKLSGFWSTMPTPLIEAAEEAGLPLLVLPEGPFDEIVNPLLAVIAGRQTENLRRSARVHNALTEAALRGEGSLVAVAEILDSALGRPAAVFEKRGALLAWTGPRELWPEAELARRLQGAMEPTSITVGNETYCLAPIPAGAGESGAVCVRGADPTDVFVLASMAHAAVVVSMLLAGRRQMESIHLCFERELIDDLLDGRLVDPAETRERAARIGWPLDRRYLVMMASGLAVGRAEPDALPSLQLEERDLPALTRRLAETGHQARLFLRWPGLGIVVHLEEGDEPRKVAWRIASRLAEDDMPPSLCDLVLGVAEPRTEVIGLAEAARESGLSILLAPAGRVPPSPVTHFRDCGPVRLLARVEGQARLTAAARSILGPVADLESPRDRELFLTLSALLARNMSVIATAKAMFFHYNTVRYRLSRLQDQLGGRLQSPSDRLSLSLAVAAVHLAEAERALSNGSRSGATPVSRERRPAGRSDGNSRQATGARRTPTTIAERRDPGHPYALSGSRAGPERHPGGDRV